MASAINPFSVGHRADLPATAALDQQHQGVIDLEAKEASRIIAPAAGAGEEDEQRGLEWNYPPTT